MKKFSVFKKLILIFTNPKELFEKVKDESLEDKISFVIGVLLSISFIVSIIFAYFMTGFTDFSLLFYLVTFFSSIIYSFYAFSAIILVTEIFAVFLKIFKFNRAEVSRVLTYPPFALFLEIIFMYIINILLPEGFIFQCVFFAVGAFFVAHFFYLIYIALKDLSFSNSDGTVYNYGKRNNILRICLIILWCCVVIFAYKTSWAKEGQLTDYEPINNFNYYSKGNDIFIKSVRQEYIKLENVDKNNFQFLGDRYVKGDNIVYYYDDVLPEADFDSFNFLNDFYAKDINYVYKGGEKIEGANPETFVILNYNYSKDNKHVYHFTDKVLGADPDTFEIYIPSSEEEKDIRFYARDKNNVYYSGEILKGADPESFSVISGNDSYTKNDQGVYMKDRLIEGSDPETFEVIDFYLSKDKNNIYYDGDILEGVDSETFEYLNDSYFKDKYNVYYSDWVGDVPPSIIEGTDSGSFHLGVNTENSETNDYYAIDKNFAYYLGERMEGVDLNTFEVIYFTNAKDKDNIYEKGRKKGGLDPDDFDLEKDGGKYGLGQSIGWWIRALLTY